MSSRASESLIWQVIKNNNSFLHKRGEPASRVGAVQFSAEPGNLLAANSFKYSGVANYKTVDVSSNKDNRVFLNTKVLLFLFFLVHFLFVPKAPKKTAFPKKSASATPLRKDRARSLKVVKSRGCSNFYRADLSTAAAARYNRVLGGVRVRIGAKKPVKSRTGPRNNRSV
jgi:large subunit ribosomal protein L28e